ncbi:hydroxymethylglutaryl-CoA synthase [Candidatus Woesebacteria bacterium]|nr:MAG: hydroxymethylglutaryl-CoA synthase [Candidatus Woesebacteria bacterium]
MKNVGIVGYGVSIPHLRIKTKNIARAWNSSMNPGRALGVHEKSVPNYDEDTITLSVEAALRALERSTIQSNEVGAIYIGSESHPYAVKPSSTIVAEAIGMTNDYMAIDTQFACKAGTANMQIVIGLVSSLMIKNGLAIGTDCAQSTAGDALEYTAAAGSAAIIIGRKNIAVKIIDTLSYSSDAPDFWRREGETCPKHAGRFTGEPAYFKHIMMATKNILEKTKTQPSDYDHVVFHMPNGKFPGNVALKMGFTEKQLKAGLVVGNLGNTYSASSMIGLCSVFDIAKPGQNILLTSYGSGSGSDAFVFETTRELTKIQRKASKTSTLLVNKKYISYTSYLRLKNKIVL